MWPRRRAKLSGRPGICFVTRGPGATNASHRPAHRLPGQHADDPVRRPSGQRPARPRNLQELDYRQVFGPGTLGALAQVVGEVQKRGSAARYVARAAHTALQGRPGPVVIVLPGSADHADHRARAAASPYPRTWPAPGPCATCARCWWRHNAPS